MSLFFDKDADPQLPTLLKRDSATSAFLLMLYIFQNKFFTEHARAITFVCRFAKVFKKTFL